MTDEPTSDNNDDNPLKHSKWLGLSSKGALGLLAGGAMAIWALMTGKLGALGDDERADRERERLERDRFDFMRTVRAVEREEEAHAGQMRWYDASFETQTSLLRTTQLERKAREAEQRRFRAEEDYWKAKLEMLAPKAEG